MRRILAGCVLVALPLAGQQEDRRVSWRTLAPNVASDQKQLWTSPFRLGNNRNWVAAAAVVGATAGLVALDPREAHYFRNTSLFGKFNTVFASDTTSYATIAAPVSLYATGLIRKDKKMQETALLATQAAASAQILTTVMKGVNRRLRPSDVAPEGNYADTWFSDRKSLWRRNASFPSGHTVAAFSVATVIARRYGNHRWVPYVAYGGAALIGFSRITLSSHFASDVFMGGALGYSIGRFVVLRQ